MFDRLARLQRRGITSDAPAAGFLDLVYVTPQLIASAAPFDSQWYQLSHWLHWLNWCQMTWRTLLEFLNSSHEDHWHIWNLQEDRELEYFPPLDFRAKITRRPIADHGPVPFEDLLKITTEIREYLQSDPQNIALVHCRRGKGRTGTVIVAYLQLYHGLSFDQALALFTAKRVKWKLLLGDGVSINSQLRYLRYVSEYKGGSVEYTPKRVRVHSLVFKGLHFEHLDVKLSNLLSVSSPANGSSTANEACSMHSVVRSQHQWEITHKPDRDTCIYRPVGNQIEWIGPDISIIIRAFTSGFGMQIPQSIASITINTTLEAASGDGDPVLTPSSFAYTVSSVSPLSVVIVRSYAWNQFDGYAGSWLRGKEAFEKLEVHWTEAPDFSI